MTPAPAGDGSPFAIGLAAAVPEDCTLRAGSAPDSTAVAVASTARCARCHVVASLSVQQGGAIDTLAFFRIMHQDISVENRKFWTDIPVSKQEHVLKRNLKAACEAGVHAFTGLHCGVTS